MRCTLGIDYHEQHNIHKKPVAYSSDQALVSPPRAHALTEQNDRCKTPSVSSIPLIPRFAGWRSSPLARLSTRSTTSRQQSSYRPTNRTIDQPINTSTNSSTGEPTIQPNRSTNQPTNKPPNLSTDRPTDRPVFALEGARLELRR